MFERFSPAAERATRLAQTEANRLGHNMTGPEHLAIALITNDRESAGAALRSFGLDRDRLRKAAGAVHPPEAPGASVAIPPFNRAAQDVLEAARRGALASGRTHVETGDVLIAVLADRAGLAVLQEAGVDAEVARQTVERIRSSIEVTSSMVGEAPKALPTEGTGANPTDSPSPTGGGSSTGGGSPTDSPEGTSAGLSDDPSPEPT